MRLLPYSQDDLWLTEAFELDPAMMTHLGGTTKPEDIPARHARRVETNAKGDWWFTIVPEGAERGVGTIGIWRYVETGAVVSEMGWMVLPPWQGKGVASKAARLVVEKARADGRFGKELIAHTSQANEASNAICRKLGFTPGAEREVENRGRKLRMLQWRLAL